MIVCVCVCVRVCVCVCGWVGHNHVQGRRGEHPNVTDFCMIEWGAFLLDEAHLARNKDTQRHKVSDARACHDCVDLMRARGVAAAPYRMRPCAFLYMHALLRGAGA